MPFDLVIRGGDVIDGSGLARFRADIGIRGGKIVRIGRINERGREEIDANDRVVTPGFIDGHTHMDAQIHWDPLGTSSCWQGVTTAVMGNCGFTLAPSRRDERALVVRNLERAEDISAQAISAGVRWDFETFPEYLNALESKPKGINYATYIGHSALRTWAMGERAFEQVTSESDIALMEAQLEQALKAGAIGLSTSRSENHETSDDRPVASRMAAWSEVRRLVNVMGKVGAGVFELATEKAVRSAAPDDRSEALGRMRDLAVESGVPITWGLSIAGSEVSEAWRAQLEFMDETTRLGGRVFGQSHSRDVTILMSFRTQLPFDKLPHWRELRSRPLEEQKALLADPRLRARLVTAAHEGPYGNAIGGEARKPTWTRTMVYKPFPPYVSLADLAAQRNADPVDVMIDLALATDMGQFFIQFVRDEDREGLLEIMRHPRTVMTFSDSGAHVGQISDCSIQTYLLAHWVRERRAFSLEEAVRMITFAPARAWGFWDRGLLREGMAADINVIDPATLSPLTPQVVRDLPSGATRLIQKAEGIFATVVNGAVLFRDGKHTGALPGLLLRGTGAVTGP
jgi:N-acyl-D-amino-acid deacylase